MPKEVFQRWLQGFVISRTFHGTSPGSTIPFELFYQCPQPQLCLDVGVQLFLSNGECIGYISDGISYYNGSFCEHWRNSAGISGSDHISGISMRIRCECPIILDFFGEQNPPQHILYRYVCVHIYQLWGYRQNPPRQNPPNGKSPAAKSPEWKIPRDKIPLMENPPR